MRKMKMKKNRRGITLAETVIAIAVVSIISAASLTFMVTSISAEKKLSVRENAVNDVQNVYECCRYAEDVNELHVIWLTYMDGACDRGKFANEFIIEKSDYTVNVTWNGGNIEILALDKSGKEIYKLNYEKK